MVDEEDSRGYLDVHAAEVAQLLDGERAGAVLGDGHVDQGDHDLAGRHGVEPGVRGDELFGEGGRHASRGRPAWP